MAFTDFLKQKDEYENMAARMVDAFNAARLIFPYANTAYFNGFGDVNGDKIQIGAECLHGGDCDKESFEVPISLFDNFDEINLAAYVKELVDERTRKQVEQDRIKQQKAEEQQAAQAALAKLREQFPNMTFDVKSK